MNRERLKMWKSSVGVGGGGNDAHDLVPYTLWCVAFAIVTAALVVLVNIKSAQVQTGYRVHDLRTELMRLRADKAGLDVEWATLTRPTRIARIARDELDLVAPTGGTHADPEEGTP
jgi:cell division protein FtsL